MRAFLQSWLNEWMVIGLTVILLALAMFSVPGPLSLDDGLRHFAMARLMGEKGITAVAGWNVFFYEGYFSQHVLDPWFLYDAFLAFLSALPAHVALKLSSMFALLAFAVSFALLLRSFGLSRLMRSLLLLVVLFGNHAFLDRMLIARPFGFITALTTLLLWSVFERQWIVMGVTIIVCVLLSQLFVFPLLVGGLAIPWLFFSGKKADAGKLAVTLLCGLALGLRLHPHAAEYILYLFDAFIRIPFLKDEAGLSAEMRSGIGSPSSMSVFVAVGAAIVFLSPHLLMKRRKMDAHVIWGVWYLLSAVAVFFIAFAFWMRAIDILWPLSVALCARIISLTLPDIRSIGPLCMPRWFTVLLGIFVMLQIAVVPISIQTRKQHDDLKEYGALHVVEKGARVLNVDWDRFSVYVVLRPDLLYATGIDPSFTYITDVRAFHLLQAISHGNEGLTRGRMEALEELLDRWPSDYVVAHKVRNAAFIADVRSSDAWKHSIVADSGNVFIMRVSR